MEKRSFGKILESSPGFFLDCSRIKNKTKERSQCFPVTVLVVMPTTVIAIIDNSNVLAESKIPPIKTIMESISKIMMPTLIFVLSLINWANKSVPPVLVSNLSIIPIPNPTNTPPIIAAMKELMCNRERRGLKISMITEETNKPWTLL